jgi:SAM-dependent methyltransferase
MDLSVRGLCTQKSEYKNLYQVSGDWDHPPFLREQFDIIVFYAALHHAEDLGITLSTICRLIRPGGWLLADHEPMASLLLGYFQKRNMKRIALESGGIENSPTNSEYRLALQCAGFEPVILRASRLNLFRLQQDGSTFSDTLLRRAPWPERIMAWLIQHLSFLPEKNLLRLIFLQERLAFGLFGITICAQKPSEGGTLNVYPSPHPDSHEPAS